MTPSAPEFSLLRFTKHHGAGNDFLVLIDPGSTGPLPADLTRALCDRHFGVGADGVIQIVDGKGAADLGMILQNADGREAEMSGNGMRCLAQAAVLSALVTPPRFTVATVAGIKTVEYIEGDHVYVAEASVDLGTVVLGPDQPQKFIDRKVRTVDMGNPHIVMFGPDLGDVDVAGIGAHLQSVYEGGINVEFITSGEEPDNLLLRVFERGVGETQACGTGSAAAAAAARSWGLVGDRVAVHNPGGTLQVTLDDDQVRLRGPVHRVASVVVDPLAIVDAARPRPVH
ncbi:MAG: diaminopimelate epimerase, partial [Acidimicrobiales bacterium]